MSWLEYITHEKGIKVKIDDSYVLLYAVETFFFVDKSIYAVEFEINFTPTFSRGGEGAGVFTELIVLIIEVVAYLTICQWSWANDHHRHCYNYILFLSMHVRTTTTPLSL